MKFSFQPNSLLNQFYSRAKLEFGRISSLKPCSYNPIQKLEARLIVALILYQPIRLHFPIGILWDGSTRGNGIIEIKR